LNQLGLEGQRRESRVFPLNALKPDESLIEIVAGLIMVLTFTLAVSVVSGGGQEGARAALIGAVGCNVAWGIIDAVFYLMTCTFERNRRLRLARAVASAPDERAALDTIRAEFDPSLAPVTQAEDREQLYRSVRKLLVRGQLPQQTGLRRDDFVGALAVFCCVLGAALPAVLPLALIDDPWIALRLSNLLVVGCLFVFGYHWAKYVEANRWLAGLGLTGLGLVLVAIAIPLGG
jgi:hypothetical protein